jgi:hypothetical protein
MLVCGRMKYDLGANAFKAGPQPPTVANVSDEGLNVEAWKLISESTLRFENTVFTVAEQQQLRWVG